MYKRIIAQAGTKGKRQMRSYTPGTQDAAMSYGLSADMKLRDSGFEPLNKAVRPALAIPQYQAGKCARRGTEACRNS